MKLFCDFDGTLIDVSARHHGVYAEVTAEFGGRYLDQRVYWNLKRNGVGWADILIKSGLSGDVVEPYLKRFRDRIEQPRYLKLDRPIAGALETIDRLAKTYGCYLVSLRRRGDNLRSQLEWLGLAPYFIEILSGHSESDGVDVKIRLVRQALGDDGGVIVGDTETDIVTGRTLGLTTIAVSSGLRTRTLLDELRPDHVAGTIAELPSLLGL